MHLHRTTGFHMVHAGLAVQRDVPSRADRTHIRRAANHHPTGLGVGQLRRQITVHNDVATTGPQLIDHPQAPTDPNAAGLCRHPLRTQRAMHTDLVRKHSATVQITLDIQRTRIHRTRTQ